jgi:outer membrane biogenesis lipoprotein LolB
MLRVASKPQLALMNGLVIACLVLFGCATTQSATPSNAEIKAEEQSREIAQSAQRCRKAAMDQAESEVATAAAMPNIFSELLMEEVVALGEQRLAACNAEASRRSDELARREGDAYQRAAEHERDFAAFMAQLTASIGR